MKPLEMLAAVSVLALAGLAGVWFMGRPDPPVPLEVETPQLQGESGSSSMITVHVAGAVAEPGLVNVPAGSRVGDVVAAAGGAAAGADLALVNLAAPVADGQQVVVPVVGDRQVALTQAGGERVAINTAAVEDLEELPGVGPVLAARIVRFREEHGPFAAVEDLLDVPGIGEAKLAELRELVVAP